MSNDEVTPTDAGAEPAAAEKPAARRRATARKPAESEAAPSEAAVAPTVRRAAASRRTAQAQASDAVEPPGAPADVDASATASDAAPPEPKRATRTRRATAAAKTPEPAVDEALPSPGDASAAPESELAAATAAPAATPDAPAQAEPASPESPMEESPEAPVVKKARSTTSRRSVRAAGAVEGDATSTGQTATAPPAPTPTEVDAAPTATAPEGPTSQASHSGPPAKAHPLTPAAAAPPTAEGQAPAQPHQPALPDMDVVGEGVRKEFRGTGRRVIVAEDEALIRLDVVETLTEAGFQVVGEAGDGERAVALATELRPDVVVMDIKMPVLDGISAAERIGKARIAPVVLLTAFSQAELVERARDAGAMAYVVKPFTPAELLPAIEIAVARHQEITALESEVADLAERFETRKRVERAKGLLMTKMGLTEPESFRWIQKTSMDRRLTMREVADAVIEQVGSNDKNR